MTNNNTMAHAIMRHAGPSARLLGAIMLLLACCTHVLAGAGDGVPTATKVAHPIAFNEETKIRQNLVQVALGREPADLVIRGATVLNVFTLMWEPNQDIVVRGKRIAWVGPSGQWKGKCSNIFDAKGLWAVPGFGESHKHIESTLLSPEWEAALVIPLGNTWTSEGSHEFSNVSGVHNVEFWDTPEHHGSPLKIFTALGSATPPSAFEVGGGNYAYKEIADNIKGSLEVQGLDEVMDWPAVSEPTHPGYQRIWEDIQATRDTRGVIDGHGAGLWDLDRINAFAATGLTSDHETRKAEEAWDKLQHGLFLQLRDENIERAVPLLREEGAQGLVEHLARHGRPQRRRYPQAGHDELSHPARDQNGRARGGRLCDGESESGQARPHGVHRGLDRAGALRRRRAADLGEGRGDQVRVRQRAAGREGRQVPAAGAEDRLALLGH